MTWAWQNEADMLSFGWLMVTYKDDGGCIDKNSEIRATSLRQQHIATLIALLCSTKWEWKNGIC